MSKMLLLLMPNICAIILLTCADYENRTEIFGLAPEQQSEISYEMKKFLKKILHDNSNEKDGFLVVYSNVVPNDYKDYVMKVVMDTGNIVAVADSDKNKYRGSAVSIVFPIKCIPGARTIRVRISGKQILGKSHLEKAIKNRQCLLIHRWLLTW